MKLLGIDYGTKRIGLATSSGIIATPHSTIHNNAQTLDNLQKIVNDEKITAIILGLPLRADGSETAMSQMVRNFAMKLEQRTGLLITFHNELLSSWEAEEYIKNILGIKNPKKIAELVDKMVASMLLQEHINRQG